MDVQLFSFARVSAVNCSLYCFPLQKEGNNIIDSCCQESTDRNCKNPGSHEAFCYSPANGREAFGCTYSDDCTCDSMRSTNGDFQHFRNVESESTGCFGNYSFQWGYFGDFGSHCLYYFPTSGHGAE